MKLAIKSTVVLPCKGQKMAAFSHVAMKNGTFFARLREICLFSFFGFSRTIQLLRLSPEAYFNWFHLFLGLRSFIVGYPWAVLVVKFVSSNLVPTQFKS